MKRKVKVSDMQDSLKTYICLYMCGGTAVLLIFCFLLYLSIGGGVSAYTPEKSNDYMKEAKYYIDHMEKAGNLLSLSGWAFIPGENIERYKTHILLRNTRSGKYIKIPTAMRFLKNVTQHFFNPDIETNYNYDMSGWYAAVRTNRLNSSPGQYEIIILYQNDNNYMLIETGRKFELE